MSHANAQLTPRARLRLALLVIDKGWTYTAAADMFMVSPRTAAKWANRYREEGPGGMADRSSRPHHSPTKTAQPVLKQIVGLRWRHRLGPVQIGGRLGLPASTVHAVLTPVPDQPALPERPCHRRTAHPKPNAEPPYPAGSTSTIITEPTPPSEGGPQPPD